MGNPLGNLYGIIKGSWGSANPRIWEKFLHATASHDLDIEAADGRVTAHAQMLMEASPVVQAMLVSPMKERQTKQIKLKDTSSSAVTLFLEVLYTCSSQGDPDYKTALSALDLAHRWQVEVVVEILADFIEGLGFQSVYSHQNKSSSLRIRIWSTLVPLSCHKMMDFWFCLGPQFGFVWKSYTSLHPRINHQFPYWTALSCGITWSTSISDIPLIPSP